MNNYPNSNKYGYPFLGSQAPLQQQQQQQQQQQHQQQRQQQHTLSNLTPESSTSSVSSGTQGAFVNANAPTLSASSNMNNGSHMNNGSMVNGDGTGGGGNSYMHHSAIYHGSQIENHSQQHALGHNNIQLNNWQHSQQVQQAQQAQQGQQTQQVQQVPLPISVVNEYNNDSKLVLPSSSTNSYPSQMSSAQASSDIVSTKQ
ncbi:hypothetical protein PACTADRAFT_34862 [Pachysolen tannophilus NRRL Y-2460]|uniref:Uncharacterized protein n=1 Tax=Pachysolen tannophilus NRRL Y-2460 TaxID=669874 RepID=A0A1E4TQU5_PACTA|nr:hypothetical protein PACTADRAFT_34862 [Pachysolen tannophilus NRRL Y-2460]